MSIFKAYDIRGVYPTEIDEWVAFRIGAAFGTLNPGTIAVGCDTRLSGPQLKAQFIAGLCSTGSDAVDLGIVTTPVLVFAVQYLGCNGGVNVTASHNPKEYNGFKLFDSAALPISYESGIERLQRIIERGNVRKGHGVASGVAITEPYITFISSQVKLSAPLYVVIDGSNGAASLYAPEACRRAGLRVHELNCTPDGTFPGHEPDPSKSANVLDAERSVRERDADLGFVFDGDGDRVAVIDETGTAIESRRIFSLLARHVLEANPGAKIVHDALMSRMATETIERYGGQAVPCRVGHTYIAQKMRDESAALAGELSGHFYFKETFFADDAIRASLTVAEIVAAAGRGIAELVREFPDYHTENVRVAVKESEKFAFVTSLQEELAREGYALDTLDGVKVLFETGWALFRASNTEPKISIAYESKDADEFNRIRDFVHSVIERVPQE
jgi:phosphomannomutase/phosphoglucomutase